MSETLLSASVIIDSPILEVFDYVSRPVNFPEWVPLWSDVTKVEHDRVKRGDRFLGKISIVPPFLQQRIPFVERLLSPWIEICADDVVPGRRIAWRARDFGWTTICDFEPMAGKTIFTTTHSAWSFQGLMASYWMGPALAFGNDAIQRVLAGLKRRLEGRAMESEPQIFFSYRQSASGHMGDRIFEALCAEFGENVVFRDKNSLVAGQKWPGVLEETIKNCRVVVLHVASPQWEESIIADADKPDDYLRKELEWVMQAPNSHRIPIVTSDVSGLRLSDILKKANETLAKATKHPFLQKILDAEMQALRLRPDPDFRHDIEQLMRAVWNRFRQDQI